MISIALRRSLLILVSICCSWDGIMQGQSVGGLQQQISPDVLQVQVRRVLLDVVATDKQGQPVRGLSKEDFTITEDGKTQQALSLDVHDLDGPPSFVPPKLPSLPVNTFVNLPAKAERGPLYLILYDMVNMEIEDQPYARAQMLKFLRSKPAGTRFAMLVATERLHLVQGFTDDPKKLLASLDGNGPHGVPPIFLYAANNGRGDAQNAISNFEEITRYLAGLPGHKNILWFAGQFPLTFIQSGDRGATPDPIYEDKIKQIVNTMAHEQISVSPVDVRGVVADQGYVPAPSGSPGAEAPLGPGQVSLPTKVPSRGVQGMDSSPIASSYLVANEIASETGGRAFYGRNDLAKALRDATETGGHYYTLTYAPSQEASGGAMRHIAVTVSKPDCELAYRRFYFADAPEVPNEAVAQEADTSEAGSLIASARLSPAFAGSMQHGAPMAHDLVFVTHIDAEGSPATATAQQMGELARPPMMSQRFRQEKGPKASASFQLQTLVISYKLSDAELKTDATRVKLRFAAAAYDREGVLLSSVVEEAKVEDANAPHRKRQPVHGVQQRIAVPLNAASLRVGVEDLLANRHGSMEVSLPLAAGGDSVVP